MNAPSRLEIEQFANDKFQADLARRTNGYAQKQARALAEVSARGNVGGYIPALIQSKQERLRAEILALADAWVEAGTTYAVPLQAWAEKALEKAVVQMAGGTNSAFEGELRLRAARTRTPLNTLAIVAGHREIERAMKSALREAKLRLKSQRIQAERSISAASEPPARGVSGAEGLLRPPRPTENPRRFPSTITSELAARRMEAYMTSKGIGQTDFARKAGTTDRTLRKFRKTGKVRRDLFAAIAKEMGITTEALLSPENDTR
jgi:hypothetical protein